VGAAVWAVFGLESGRGKK